MSGCPCDQFVFPPHIRIDAGLARFPRQIALFAQWREAMLAATRRQPALREWRARASGDFGVMWLEMAAYVLDTVSFYDEVFAHEAYIRSAVLPDSLRGLIALLGYLPRPAVAAVADLAAFGDGRKPVTLPSGSAFRSGAFDGNPPQVFELTAPAALHPFFNEWKLKPVRPSILPPGQADFILARPGGVSVKKGEAALFITTNATNAVTINAADPFKGADGESYTKVLFNRSIHIASGTLVETARLLKPQLTAGPFTLPSDSGSPIYTGHEFKVVNGQHVITKSRQVIVLDAVYRTLRKGQHVLVSREDEYRWFKVVRAYESTRKLGGDVSTTVDNSDGTSSTITSDAPKTPVTIIHLDSLLTATGRSNNPDQAEEWDPDKPEEFTIHFGMASAAEIAVEASTELSAGDPLVALPPREAPAESAPPGAFLIEDLNGDGTLVSASLDLDSGALTLAQGSNWSPPFRVPVKLHGNVIQAVRGETVPHEILGAGNSALSNQVFELKKKPLTYVSSPTANNGNGVAAALRVWVDSVEWRELPTFFGARPEDEVFIVRTDEQGAAKVMFGDGIRGRRLRTGALVTASYRFGAGAAAPPAGSITQIAKGAAGLKAVRQPVPAYGGADVEPAAEARRFGPASSLLLGRAVSLADLEAAAAREPGVVAAKSAWRWHETKQRPVAQIYYIGDAGLEAQLRAKLENLVEPFTPLVIAPAEAVVRELSIAVDVDARYLEQTVLANVRAALLDAADGLLAPARIGIGAALFRSRIYECVLAVEGAVSVTSLLLNGEAFPGASALPGQEYGVSPGTGRYFDFAAGGLILNGGTH